MHPKLANLGLGDVIEHLREYYSYDGMATNSDWTFILRFSVQVLIDNGYESAGVGIDSAAPKGVYKLTYAEIKSIFPVLSRLGNKHKAVNLIFDEFHYAFANNLSKKDAKIAYDKYTIPDTRRTVFESVFDDFNSHDSTNVNYKNDKRSPLLLITGGNNHIVPSAVSKSNYNKYSDSSAVTDFPEFPDHSHRTILEKRMGRSIGLYWHMD